MAFIPLVSYKFRIENNGKINQNSWFRPKIKFFVFAQKWVPYYNILLSVYYAEK
jgi:hypothetical protein